VIGVSFLQESSTVLFVLKQGRFPWHSETNLTPSK
jgi:hypothetical protein